MSFLYRPTPVVVIGGGAFSSHRTIGGHPGATMLGIPAGGSVLGKAGPSGGVSRGRRVDTRRQPWILSGGTMGEFVPNGLGQDDGSLPSDFFSGASASPDIPPPPDFFSGASASPNIPISTYTPPGPDLGLPSFSPGTYAPIPISSGPPAPSAGAGPTGTGIPGTQALNVAQQGISFFQKIFGTTKPVTPGYAALPGYGGPPASSAPSWFSQKTIAPAVGSNGMVAAVAVVALLVLGGGGFAAGRSGR
jgi:hypothetical protein